MTTKVRALIAILVLSLVAASCGDSGGGDTSTSVAETTPPATTPPATAPPATTEAPAAGSAINGGLLYDKWWAVTGADEPTDDNPVWARQTTNERSGGDTWRCKECHGWDYQGADGAYGSGSHATGFPGILGAQGKSVADITAQVSGETDPEHDFSGFLSESEIADLAAFIQEGLADYAQFIDADKKIVGGDVTNGEALYVATCVACHGADGTTLNFGSEDEPEFVGTIAIDNPWEFFHKVRFGQPGSSPPMPSAVASGWSLEDVADVAAYAQTLPTAAVDLEAAVLGGLLYDNWYAATGADEPTDDNPVWARQTTNERSGGDAWRCKECHGWDYQGADGAYGSGSHFTGFPGIFAAQGKAVDDIIAQIAGETDPEHDFSGFLSEDEIAALAAFIESGLLDMRPLFDLETKATVGGDGAAGEELFTSTCAACHGDDGTTLNFGSDDEPEYVGTLALDNPWEVGHKILFGHPGSAMPAQFSNGWGAQEVLDLVTYLQTLP